MKAIAEDVTKRKVLVVAQTPPPFHGQAIMTQYFLAGHYAKVELHYIRMAFSEKIEQIGHAELRKVIHLFTLIVRIVATRAYLKPDILYFPPAGPNRVPFLRDCVLLIATRWMFPRTVFHFHAAGLPNLYKRLPRPLKILFRLAYNHPDVAISISQDGVRDANFLKARHTALVPNGIPDVWQNRPMHRQNPKPMILFLAMVCEEKGVGILIEACKILKSRRQEFSCKIVGRASSEQELANLREKAGTLCDCIEFIGAVTGDTKWKLFEKADIFCFPTFYASESFGLVVVEAMMAGLPVVATNWRALPEIVVDGQTGFLVPVQDSTATADKLEHLLRDATLRQIMGEAARSRFLEHYRVETFQSGMEKALLLAWHDGNQDHLND